MVIVGLILAVWAVCALIRWKRGDNNVFTKYYYFDANATTPMPLSVLRAYTHGAYLGNASTTYYKKDGLDVIESCAGMVREVLHAPRHYVVFNSGASEGNSYALRIMGKAHAVIRGVDIVGKPHIVSSSIEHKSILMCLDQMVADGIINVTLVAPDYTGCIDPVAVGEAVGPNTVGISIMHVNNETGAINEIAEIGKIVRAHNLIFHSDIAQSFAKLPVDASGIDIVTASAHKIYGPPGVGIAVLSERVRAAHLAEISGTQFDSIRGGTENLPGIAAMKAAIEYTRSRDYWKLGKLRTMVLDALRDEFGCLDYHLFYGKSDDYVPSSWGPGIAIVPICLGAPGTLMISIIKTGMYDMRDRFCNIKLKSDLLDAGVVISIGSACNTNSKEASHVLRAIRAPFVIRSGVIRISFTLTNTVSDVKSLIFHLKKCIYYQI